MLTAVAGTYVYIKVTGPILRQMAHDFTLEAHRLGKRLGIHAYLVDLTDARNTDTIPANYAFAYVDMRGPGFDRKARVAVVVHPDDHSHDFVETAAKNAGIDFTLFRDRQAALAHLCVTRSHTA